MAGSARQQILEVASQLFFQQGFRAVGVDTIIAQSGVAKMTLYRHFPSKDDLIVAYLEDSNQKFWGWFEEAIRPYAGQPKEQITGLFAAVGKLATSPACYGCTFQTTAAEFPDPDHPGHKVALAHKQAVRERFRQMAGEAGAREPEKLADELLLVMDGAWVAARMYRNSHPNPAIQAATAAQHLLEAHLNFKHQ